MITNDDPGQAAIANEIVDTGFVLLATVLLEVEWVLRSVYRMPREQLVSSLRLIVDLPGASVLPVNVQWAIDRFEEGADFADALHVANAEGSMSFVTFDRNIGRMGASGASVPIEILI